jgi:myo-inositol-1(or 4)-monophosphatase
MPTMSDMRAFVVELARHGGRIARGYFQHVAEKDIRAKGSRDYVSHVDRLVQDAIAARIQARFPEHQILGEEGEPEARPVGGGAPLWVIDPIDGTTNFLHGLPAYAVSIAFCVGGEPIDAVVYDPSRDEAFIGERGVGLWLNDQRMQTSGCTDLGRALVATTLPFRLPEALDDVARVQLDLARRWDDVRRSGSAALDLAWTAVGRIDAYYELGLYPWDTAAGELLVRCGGGVATDFRGATGGLLGRRSIVSAATPALHAELLAAVQPLTPWLDRLPPP